MAVRPTLAVHAAPGIALWLKGHEVASALAAFEDGSGEVYAPALESINASFGSSLSYSPEQGMIGGAAGDGTMVALPVAASPAAAGKDHTAFVVDGQAYVPLHALARLMGNSFSWDPHARAASLMPMLSSVALVPLDRSVRVQLHSSAPLGFVKVSYYDSPWRIVLDVTGARAWPGSQRTTIPGIAQVRWREWPSPGHVRVVIQLTSRLTFHMADATRASDYWLDVDQTPGAGGPTPLPGSSDVELADASAPADGSGGSAVETAGQNPAAGQVGTPGSDPNNSTPAADGGVPPAAVNVLPVAGMAGATAPGDGGPAAGSPGAEGIAPAKIENIVSQRVDPRTTEVTIKVDRPVECRPAFCDSPSRLVLDIPNSRLKLLSPDLMVSSPGLTKIRTGTFPKGSKDSRVVLDLTSRSVFRVWSEQDKSLIRVLVREMQPAPGGGVGGSPVAGHTICIDPGHCGVFHGCRGYFGLKEEEVSLDVAQRLAQLLMAANATVVMTRNDMGAPSGGGEGLTSDLLARAEIGNRAHADLFLSIHCNAMPDGQHGSVRGSQTIYSHPGSAAWARTVYHALLDALGHGGDGLHYRPRIKVTEYSECPATLAELGFLDNRSDAELLADPNFRQKEAECLFHAFEAYFAHQEYAPSNPWGNPVPTPEPQPAPDDPGNNNPGTNNPGTDNPNGGDGAPGGDGSNGSQPSQPSPGNSPVVAVHGAGNR